MKPLFCALICLLLCSSNANAQTLINKAWQDTTGHPTITNQFYSAKLDASGNLYTAGSTYHAGQAENLLITKYSSSGTKVWQKEYDSPGSYADILTDFYIKGSSYYCTGTYWDSVHSKSWAVTLKGKISNGDTSWTRTYNGSYGGLDAGGTIKVDNTGKVYVGGSDQQSSTNFRMLALKYDSSGTQQWVSFYDSSGYYDGAVDMQITTIMGGTPNGITMVGFSGSAFSHWDFVTAGFNPTTGALGKVTRSANANGAFSTPAGIVKDNSDNIYIAGTAAVTGTNTDIKIIKYDTLLNQTWLKTWGNADSLNDQAAVFTQDASSNLLITGYTTQSNGAKNMLVLKYNTSGTLQWSRTINAPNPTKDCTGNDIIADDSLNVYVTGKVSNGSDNDFITVCFDKNGTLKWQKNYSGGTSSNDQSFDVVVDSAQNVYVSGSSALASTRYVTLCYQQLSLNTPTKTDTTHGKYYEDQVIVRFKPTYVNPAFVNNKDLTFAVLTDVVPDSIITKMNAVDTITDFHRVTICKIFDFLTTSDTVSIRRSGDTIRMPKFWSNFILKIPTAYTGRATRIVSNLRKIPYTIFKTSLNGAASLTSFSPNDTKFTATKQKALCDATSGIGVCNAWDNNFPNYRGSSDIKIGHYDTGVRFDHEDFQINGSSRVVAGDDYNSNPAANLLSNPNNDVDGHGTNTASIFGAVTNNSKGIAGIAGGDAGTGTSGVSIYEMKVTNGTGGAAIPIANIFKAYVKAAFMSPSSDIGYGVHITTHSYVTTADADGLMLDGIRWCFRNGVTTVASSGNDNTTTLNYPASFYDDWVIKVGGNDESGNRWQSADGIHGSTYDNNIDVLAPASNTSSDYVTYCTNSPTNTGYDNSGEGTSLASPFVAGAAALAFGYIKNIYPTTQYSEPQDLENLIQFYATGTGTYSTTKGWGLLNIGNMMSHLSYPKYKVRHFYGAFDNTNSTLVASNVNMTLKYGYETTPYPQDVILPRSDISGLITYTVDVYRVSGTVTHALDATEDIVYTPAQHAWILNSQSNMFGNYNTGTNELTPEVDVTLSNVTRTSADVEGYTYHFTAASNNGSFASIWVPFDITNNYGTFAYSLHTNDAAINSIHDVADEFSTLKVYPNPSSTEITLSFYTSSPENTEIHIYNINGQEVFAKTFGNSDGAVNFTLPTSQFANGIYAVQMRNERTTKQLKFVISH